MQDPVSIPAGTSMRSLTGKVVVVAGVETGTGEFPRRSSGLCMGVVGEGPPVRTLRVNELRLRAHSEVDE